MTASVKILIDDASGRFRKGEVGTATRLQDPGKYDYEVLLPRKDHDDWPRIFFFRAGEVKLL